MNQPCRFSDVTKDYLSAFYEILDEMICKMTGAELSDSISHNFIVQMIPHHEAAIRMSENILRYTTSLPLQDIAAGIITEQTKSIRNMRDILSNCEALENSRQDLCLYQRHTEQIMQTMFSGMKCAQAENRVDCNFMWEMIPHHRGAVEMSKNALRYDICPGLVPILQAIISSQEKGIRQMQRLLRCIGC